MIMLIEKLQKNLKDDKMNSINFGGDWILTKA